MYTLVQGYTCWTICWKFLLTHFQPFHLTNVLCSRPGSLSHCMYVITPCAEWQHQPSVKWLLNLWYPISKYFTECGRMGTKYTVQECIFWFVYFSEDLGRRESDKILILDLSGMSLDTCTQNIFSNHCVSKRHTGIKCILLHPKNVDEVMVHNKRHLSF